MTEDSGYRRSIARWIRESRRDEFFWLRVVGGSTGIALAVVAAVSDGVHAPFLILVGISAFVLAFPWHRLSALRAGPFEFSLAQGQIDAAVNSIQIEGAMKDRLRDLLSRLRTDIERARGSRVLWVDDDPLRVVAERRLLRALGIETVSIPFSRDAAETLRRDNDFDLVVTSLFKDTEKEALDPRPPAGSPKLGVLFVEWLRGGTGGVVEQIYGTGTNDRLINNLPVIFYVAAVGMGTLRKEILPAAELEPGVELSQRIDDFLAKTIRSLADARSDPISVPAEKGVPGSSARMRRA